MNKNANVFEAVLDKLGDFSLSKETLDKIEQLVNNNRSVKDIVKTIKGAL